MCIVFYRQEAPLEPILMGCGNYILSMVPRIDAARFRATRFDVHLITIIVVRVSNHGYHVLQPGGSAGASSNVVWLFTFGHSQSEPFNG